MCSFLLNTLPSGNNNSQNRRILFIWKSIWVSHIDNIGSQYKIAKATYRKLQKHKIKGKRAKKFPEYQRKGERRRDRKKLDCNKQINPLDVGEYSHAQGNRYET